MQRIYLDACALNRLTDDQAQARIRSEAEAIQEIFRMVWDGRLRWVASIVLRSEIRRNPDLERRQDVLSLLSFASEQVTPNRNTMERAETLQSIGYGAFDALHLACSEQAAADVLVTTDDRFLRQAARGLGGPQIAVRNPIDWLQEVRR
jgi:predicted nucleic acid-binding protein